MSEGTPVPLEQYFAGHHESRGLYDAVVSALDEIGDCEQRVTKSQVAFRRRIGFAWVWIPGRYLQGDRPPLVLTIGLSRRDNSPRWKEIVEPHPGRFTHHLELSSAGQIDDEVRAWLKEAWEGAA